MNLDLFLLCAGKGERLRPLTEATPKPLLSLLGKTLADRVLEACSALPVRSRLINAHHLADQVQAFANDRKLDHLQMEPVLLDSGGALGKAFSSRKLQAAHVLCHNGDIVHEIDLEAAWKFHLDSENDVTLVMVDVPEVNTVLVKEGSFGGVLGHPACPAETDGTRRLTFSGIAFYRTSLFQGCSSRPWTIKDLWHRRAFEQGGKVGCLEVPAGTFWEDCGVPQDLAQAAFHLLEKTGQTQWIAPTAKVSVDALLGEQVIVEAGAWVDAGARLDRCLVQPDARVGLGQVLERTVRNLGGDASW
jgi:mannose-1-phosphate guanylyltransferase